jgi:hypothetical protein
VPNVLLWRAVGAVRLKVQAVQRICQFPAGIDAQLGEDFAQMPLNGAVRRAERRGQSAVCRGSRQTPCPSRLPAARATVRVPGQLPVHPTLVGLLHLNRFERGDVRVACRVARFTAVHRVLPASHQSKMAAGIGLCWRSAAKTWCARCATLLVPPTDLHIRAAAGSAKSLKKRMP